MKFSCNRQKLFSAASNASRAALAKSSVPALEGVLIKAEKGAVSITGFDLELGITSSIETAVSEIGSVVVNARLFCDIIRKIDSENVELTCDKSLVLLIKGGKSEFTLQGLSSAEYPEIPTIPAQDAVKIGGCVLKSMIDQTLFAVSANEQKPVHTGSLFEVSGGVLTVVSVDGFRLALRKENASTGQDISFVVPGKTLSDVSKMVEEDDTDAVISVGKKHVVFEFGGYTIISRLLEGSFLDYKSTIPATGSTVVKVKTRELCDSIDRTSLLITDRLRSPLKIDFEEETIKISCVTAMGRAYDEIPCESKGPSVRMGFNNRYLIEALRATDCDEVSLEIGGPLAPMKIVSPASDSFLFLVLPVRLKNDN